MGIFLLGSLFLRAPWLYQEKRFHPQLGRFGDAAPVVAGVAFGFGWSPCIGPILGSILAIASTQDRVWAGATLLVAYTLGLGLPFLVTGLALGRVSGALSWVKRHFPAARRHRGRRAHRLRRDPDVRPTQPGHVRDAAGARRHAVRVARGARMSDLDARLAFVLEIDALKSVLRRNSIRGGERRENTAEHSWHLALMAIVLAPHSDAPIDTARVVADACSSTIWSRSTRATRSPTTTSAR